MQPTGSLTANPLRNLLDEAQSERATGTLAVRDGNGHSCTLYFLFGHLFHAVADDGAGDEAVIHALNWPGGEFSFDAKAKLPADETVKSSISELIRSAEAAVPAQPAPPPPPAPEPEPVAKAPEPEPAPQAAPADPGSTVPPARSSKDEPVPRRGVKHRPEPRQGREPFPVPQGQLIYDSLKTSFVDFPRLITTLEKEEYTGYVRLLTDNASGLIFFSGGAALECAYDEGSVSKQGKEALMAFNNQVTEGHGVLDVVGLSADLVEGLHELTVAQPMYTELYASWVNMNSLIEFLVARKHTGSVMVRGADATGVIILTGGTVSGAYTSDSREITQEIDHVLALCTDPKAMIEVKSADTGGHPPLDVDEVVGSRANSTTAPSLAAFPVGPPVAAAPTPQAQPVQAPQPQQTAPAPMPTLPQQATIPPVVRADPPTQTLPPAAPPLQNSPPPGFTQPSFVPQPGQPPLQQPGATMPPGAATLPPPAVEQFPTFQTASPTAQAFPEHTTVDWEEIIGQLQQLAEESLGNRSRKVKDILGGAERSRAGVERAIDEIPTISLLFVDSSRLEALAQDMRGRLQSLL